MKEINILAENKSNIDSLTGIWASLIILIEMQQVICINIQLCAVTYNMHVNNTVMNSCLWIFTIIMWFCEE